MTGALPPAILCAALGFALAATTMRRIVLALALLVAVAVIVSLMPLPPRAGWIFAGLWISTALTAATVHLKQTPAALPVILAINAGSWAGAAAATGGNPLDLARALPAALVALPAAWLVARRARLAIQVVASWLIAVAILAATLPIVPTPGYSADHRG